MTLDFPRFPERQNFEWMAEEEEPLAKDVARWVKRRVRGPVVDMGCGPGHFVEAMREQGIEATGYDIEVRKASDYVKYIDLTGEGLPSWVKANVPTDASLVLCLEVLEHIRPAQTAKAVRNLVNLTDDLIIFSAAQPGQGGIGHINCRSRDHWKSLFLSWSEITYSERLTADLIESVDPLTTPVWFLNNVMVFEKAKIVSPSTSSTPPKVPASSLAG